jgi:hypothetical protein
MNPSRAMRALIAVLAAFVASHATAGEAMTARNSSGDVVHLTLAPCTNPDVLKRLKPEYVDQFHAAQSTVDKEDFAACWIVYGDDIFLFYEDGDKALIPISEFKPDGV